MKADFFGIFKKKPEFIKSGLSNRCNSATLYYQLINCFSTQNIISLLKLLWPYLTK